MIILKTSATISDDFANAIKSGNVGISGWSWNWWDKADVL